MLHFKPVLRLLRPHQYLKNGFVWLPLFFGHKLDDPEALLKVSWAFVVLSLVSSVVYVINDIRDREEDRLHPEKCHRPLAEGSLTILDALIVMAFVLSCAIVLSLLLLPVPFLLFIAAYLLLNTAYSFFLKHIAVIDVFCVAAGFVLRVAAGGYVANIPVSHWIMIMTFLLALLVALGKRRSDLLLSSPGHSLRRSLDGYTAEFISLSMVIMSSVVIVAYILYCVSPEVVEKYRTGHLYLTAFWVLAGVLRYMQLVFVRNKGGSPTLMLLQDGFLWAVIAAWLITFFVLIYMV